MVDMDALALNYSRQNVGLNNLSNIKIYASLGYDDVKETDFDLIVSNIPAKVGEPVLFHILRDARLHLRSGGQVAIVVIDAIAGYVAKVLTDPSINLLFRKSWPGHVVYHYEFSSGVSLTSKPKHSAFDRGIYDRGRKNISIGSLKIPIQTAYGLSEFDTLDYETELLLDSLQTLSDQHINRAIVFNPGQGFIPVTLSRSTKVQEIALVGRDLLALRVSRRNLELNGYPTKKVFLLHQADIYQNHSGPTNCVIGILEEKDGPAVHKMFVQQAVSELAPKGLIILASSSTAITRIESFIRSEKLLYVLERRRNKGKSVIIFKKKIS
jgi:16S rRNA G1207 methylase RsmC